MIRKYRPAYPLVAGFALLGACGGGGDGGSGGGGQPNRAPTAANGNFTTNEDTPLTQPLGASDPDGQSLTVTIVRTPTLGTLTTSAGTSPTFTYTPLANRNGSETFSYTVSDGAATSAEATVNITITPVNDPPQYGRDPENVSTNEDLIVSRTIDAFDVDGDALSIDIVTPPRFGTVVRDATNPLGYVFTPAANFVGGDQFELRVTDGQATTATRLIGLTFLPVDDPPVVTISAPPQPLAPDTLVTLTCSATDPDGPSPTSFQWSVVSGPALTRTSATTMRFLTPSFAGGTSVTYSCFTDGTNGGSSFGGASITLAIASAPDLDGDGLADAEDPDDDDDGYADFYETLLGFDARSSASAPDGSDPVVAGVDFAADHDGDGMRTDYEAIARGDPLNPRSTPEDADGDRIPNLIDRNGGPDDLFPFVIAVASATKAVDVSAGERTVPFRSTLGDATSVGRARFYLSPLGNTNQPHEIVVDTLAQLSATIAAARTDSSPIGRFAPPGDWDISRIEVRDSLFNAAVTGVPHAQGPNSPSRLRIDNGGAAVDETAPALTGFRVLDTPVDPSTGGQRVRFEVTFTDAASRLTNVDIALTPPADAISFPWDEPLWLRVDPSAASSTVTVTSPVLPNRLASGDWRVLSVTLRESAGNFTTLSLLDLQTAGFDSVVTVANSGFDTQYPHFSALAPLAQSVDAATGTARLRWRLTFGDDRSGVRDIEIVAFHASSNTILRAAAALPAAPTTGTLDLETAALPTDIARGIYEISTLALVDGEGHRRQFNTADLVDLGIDVDIEVR